MFKCDDRVSFLFYEFLRKIIFDYKMEQHELCLGGGGG